MWGAWGADVWQVCISCWYGCHVCFNPLFVVPIPPVFTGNTLDVNALHVIFCRDKAPEHPSVSTACQ